MGLRMCRLLDKGMMKEGGIQRSCVVAAQLLAGFTPAWAICMLPGHLHCQQECEGLYNTC